MEGKAGKQIKSTMTHASLFSGFGAADLAACWMGWDNVFWCEIDKFPQTILSYWFPKSVGYEDIKETDFSIWCGRIDVLTGGFPCQPFSVAGQRKGTDDDRYLWPEMLRAVREIRPAWVVGENVAGIVSMVQSGSEITVESQAALFEKADKETLLEQEFITETICRNLEEEGYSVQPIVIPACAVGAPHRRDRVWFVARRVAAYADSDRRRERTDKQKSLAECQGTPDNCNGGKNGAASNSYHEMLQGRIDQTEEGWKVEGKGLFRQLHCVQNWQEFPTQSPVCGGDDGLPFGVGDLTIPFSRWRKEVIKGYGNAMVPQVIYEIFKAIEISDKQ